MFKSALSALIGILLIIISQQPVVARHLLASTSSLTLQEKVDSLFKTNFLSIQQKLTTHQPLADSESDFIYVVSLMSGIDFDLGGHASVPLLTSQKLRQFRIWYKSYKNKVEWRKYQQGIQWLHTQRDISPYDDDALNKNELLLHSLRIK